MGRQTRKRTLRVNVLKSTKNLVHVGLKKHIPFSLITCTNAHLHVDHRNILSLLTEMSRHPIDCFRNIFEDEVEEKLFFLQHRGFILLSGIASATHLVPARVEIVLQLHDVLMVEFAHDLQFSILNKRR